MTKHREFPMLTLNVGAMERKKEEKFHCVLTLLKRLETTFGVRGTVLDWFVSDLSGCFQSVIVDGIVSASRPLVYGVPQGSVLGLVLFTLYSQLLSDVISVHNCDYHKYADDTELSKSAPPDQFPSVQSCIQTCINDVLLWMHSNKLKLNTDKTEVMPVGSASWVGRQWVCKHWRKQCSL